MSLPFPGLMDELFHYHDLPKETLGNKALRIEIKARRAGKKELAARIGAKYQHLYPKSDSALAFGWMLMATKK